MMLSHDVLRWLLRPLGEPAFLYLYLDGEALPFRCFSDAFWSLAPDTEHPVHAHREAWDRIAGFGLEHDGTRRPTAWFVDLLRALRRCLHEHAEASDIVRFWSLPELFELPGREPSDTAAAGRYHEIHCHLRGAVPYSRLWEGWLADARWRATLRGHTCEAGPHRRTWAELVSKAADCHTEFRDARRRRGEHADGSLQAVVAHVVDGRAVDEVDDHAVRYLAVATALRRELVHQRRVTGLSVFHTAYERYSRVQRRGTRDSDARLVRCTLMEFEAQGAVAVELRPTLERRRGDLQRKLRSLVEGYCDYVRTKRHGTQPVVLGLVPSLYKQEALGRGAGDEPADAWRVQADVWCAQVQALLAVLEDVPALRYFVVGLDAAGKERGCPPRGLASAFREVRRYNASHGLNMARPGRDMARPSALDWDTLCRTSVPPVRLGITVHAGEDFEDPMTGLRHIWEALIHLDLAAGDRIGHALAAGLERPQLRTLLDRRARAGSGDNVRKLPNDDYRVLKPRGEHLLDLAWRFEWADGADRAHVALAQRALGHELAAGAAGAFGTPVDPRRLSSALNLGGFVVTPPVPAARYADPQQVSPEDRCHVTLDDAWFEAFERLRQRVLRELVVRGIVVESCPSSNMVIANLAGTSTPLTVFTRHPGLRCGLGTDDPGLFGSWPSDELRRVDAGYEAQVLETNRRASFVRVASPSIGGAAIDGPQVHRTVG